VKRSLLAGAAALAFIGCQNPRSAAGFSLPAGDPGRGKQAFVTLKCHECHRVAGVPDLPEPVASPPVPVALGGEIPHVRTDGELVASIIHPSHRIARGYPVESVTQGGVSRMPDYADVMTVRQMVDLVAFLQAQYVVVRPTLGRGR
jgi:mono/diheme cytochrome c family protein